MAEPCPRCNGNGKVLQPDPSDAEKQVATDCAWCNGTGVKAPDDPNAPKPVVMM